MNLRERRQAAGMSQEMLARKINKSGSMVRLYENGYPIPPDVQKRIDSVIEKAIQKRDSDSAA